MVAEAGNETDDARARLQSAPFNDVDATQQQRALVEPIIARGATRDFAVVLAGPTGAGDLSEGGATYTRGLDRTSVPASLVEHFSEVAEPAWTYTRIRREGPDGTRVVEPGVVVGSQVTLPADGRTYTLYLLFPLSGEERTLDLVSRALLTAGSLLLVLVAGVAFLVTRQVVTPVRMAADGSPSGWRRAGCASAWRSRARTTWPGWRPRSTRWPATCSARSASSRSSAGSSSASSPTSATSCARR